MDEAVTKQQALDALDCINSYEYTYCCKVIRAYIESPPSAPRADAVEAKQPAEADTRLLDWMATQHWVTVNCYADSFGASSLGKVQQRAQGYATLRGALETLRNADRAAIAQGADEGERNG